VQAIEKEMCGVLFVRRTLSVKALRATCWVGNGFFIDMNVLRTKLNKIRRRRCISIEKEMRGVLFVRRTLSVKALRAMCLGGSGFFIDMNALRAKLKIVQQTKLTKRSENNGIDNMK